jgi:hypothetical protein
MQRTETFQHPTLPDGFAWFNEPARYTLGDGLEIWTDPETDFWQRTFYDFRRDDGHALLIPLAGDFSISTWVEYRPQAQYDQCGLMVRVDAENWIKLSTEYETETLSRLGSVVTNLGFSDWATQDVPSTRTAIGYRISRSGPDFRLEYSHDGQAWIQMRVTHLHRAADPLQVGVYTCSPIGRDFWCRFRRIAIADNEWVYQGEP